MRAISFRFPSFPSSAFPIFTLLLPLRPAGREEGERARKYGPVIRESSERLLDGRRRVAEYKSTTGLVAGSKPAQRSPAIYPRNSMVYWLSLDVVEQRTEAREEKARRNNGEKGEDGIGRKGNKEGKKKKGGGSW